ncbi:GDSL esterase/lipase [Senna tora]|uniref:GDSL esterase/lipase n=1 Tax=Senna tora TaxID=362788 RepID=A0A834U1N3_9FABA|nr:GDSL esterase/lipase [Senna tora]
MNTNYLTTICFLLALLLPLPSSSKNIPALYAFGDSLIDGGNNNYLNLPLQGKANFPPYGIDFGGKPTGRYTNGKTVVDYIAILLGLPLVPPYLGLSKHQRSKITTGINYASGGSGILQETNNETILTFDHQIKFFKRTVENDLPQQFKEKVELEKHLSESLFVVSTGVNDYFQIKNRILPSTRSFALYLLKEISIHLQTLYRFGARKFFVNNIPPAGCFPASAVRMRPRGNCNQTLNTMIISYNKRLPGVLYQLQSQLPGFTFVHSDLYGFLSGLKTSAHKYGILNTWKPCCPNSIHGNLRCLPNTVPCEDRNTHLFFGEHPSQITNHIFARRCFHESTICRPLSLKHFAQASSESHGSAKRY